MSLRLPDALALRHNGRDALLVRLNGQTVWEPDTPGDDDYFDAVNADEPFAWWRFSETSGSTVADEVDSNDGTVFGADLDVSGPAATGSAVSFNGVDDYINVGQLSGLAWGGSNGLTIEVLFKTTSSTQGRMIFGALNTGDPKWIAQVLWTSTGRLEWALGYPDFVTATRKVSRSSSAAAIIADGEWHHLAFVYTDASTALQIYLDGEDDTGVVAENNSVSGTSSFPSDLYVGARNLNGAAGLFGNAVQDEFAVYDRALPAARILAHAQAAGVA